MKARNETAIKTGRVKSSRNIPEGYKYYPAKEDIYRQGIKENDIDPEDIHRTKVPNERRSGLNEKDFDDDVSGDDLDIPGAELDDEMESVGSEDEENNYYSLGGDNNF